MKPFDLDKAKAGAPVVTRGGRLVTEIHLFETCTGGYPLIAVIDGCRHTFTVDGKVTKLPNPTEYDLFMATTKKTVWANHYRYTGTCENPKGYSYLFDTEEEADGHNRQWPYDRIGGKAMASQIEE